jgi:general secretion pathway protein H
VLTRTLACLPRRYRPLPRVRGFTLLELIIVITIMALATAGVSLALRDGGDALLEREALRLSALLESARAQSRATGAPVRWSAQPQGFAFDGLPPTATNTDLANTTNPNANAWLDARTYVVGSGQLILGPEPILQPQTIVIGNQNYPGRNLRVTTDGLHPFQIEAAR